MMRSWIRHSLRLFAVLLGGMVLVLALVSTRPGTRWAVSWLFERIDLSGARLSAAGVDGRLPFAVSFTDLQLRVPGKPPLVEVDSLHLRYTLWRLLYRELRLREVHAAGVRVHMEEDAGGTWDLLGLLPQDTTQSSLRVIVDNASLREGSVEAAAYAPGRDSLYRLTAVALRLQDLDVGDALAFELDTLQVDLHVPGQEPQVALRARAGMSEGQLVLHGLRLTSPASQVEGAGTLRLAPGERPLDEASFTLSAHPIAFDDIRLFVPTLAPGGSATIDLQAASDAGAWRGEASVVFHDGGRLDASAYTRPYAGEPLLYRLQATLQQLDPGLLAGPALRGVVDARLAIDLQGGHADSLDGELRLEAPRLAIGSVTSGALEWVVRLERGGGPASLSAQLGKASLDIGGDLRPFDQEPVYRLAGRLEHFDLADLHLEQGGRSDLNIAFTADGRGIDPATAAAQFGFILEPSTVNESRTGTGTTTLQLDGGTLAFMTDLRAGSGVLTAAGRLGLVAPYPLQIEQGSFEALDLAALLGDATPSRLAGTFTATATGASPQNLDLEARLTLQDSRYGAVHVHDAVAEVVLEEGLAGWSLMGRMEGGEVRLAGRMRPFDPEPTYTLETGRLANVDLARLMGMPAWSTELNADLTGEGRSFQAPSFQARLTLDPSRINTQRIDHAALTLDAAGDTLRLGVLVDTPAGEQHGAAWMARQVDTWAYRVDIDRIEGLNLGAWLGDEGLETDLHGRLRAEGAGTDPGAMVLALEVALDPSSVHGRPVQRATLEGRLRDGEGSATIALEQDAGRAEAAMTVRGLGYQPSYTLSGSVQDLDVAALAGLDTLASRITGTFALEGAGKTLRATQGIGRVDLAPGSFGGIPLRASRLRLRLHEGVLHTDTLRLDTGAFEIEGHGGLMLPGAAPRLPAEFALKGRMKDLRPLRRWLGVETLGVHQGEVTARIVSRPAEYRLEAQFTGSGVAYEAYRVADARARWIADVSDSLTVIQSDLFGRLDVASIPGFVVEQIEFETSVLGERLPFRLEARVDAGRSARLAGAVYTAVANPRVELETLEATLDGDTWALDRIASISLGDEYRVRNFLLESGDQQIAIDGVVDLDGEQNLGVSVDAFRVASVAGLLGYEGLAGELTGNLDLRGPAASPDIVASARLLVGLGDEPVGDLALIAEYDSLRLDLDLLMKHVDGSTLSVNGFVPANLALQRDALPVRSDIGEGPVALNARADSFTIGWILPFLDPELIDRLDGTLSTRLRVDGTAALPVFHGEGDLRLRRVRAPFLGVTYEDVAVGFSTRDNVVYVDDARARTGEGRVDAAGVVAFTRLDEGTFDLDIAAREFLAVDSREYRAVTSGTMKLGGTIANPALSGNLLLRRADVFLDAWTSEDTTAIVLTPADELMLERTFGIRVTEKDTSSFDLYEAMALDLDVRLDRDSWLRSRINPEMNIQFTGSLDVAKEPFKDPAIFGSIEVVPERSYIKEFGKRFAIEKGALSFNGPATEPVMDFEARYNVPNPRSQENAVTILLDAQGEPDALNLTLSSEPTMELTDIVSYIATGQPASEALLLGGPASGDFVSAGRGFAVSQGVGLLTGAVEDLVQRSGLELDVIQIETNPSGRGATVTAGKYVTPKVYTSVSQPIGSTSAGGVSNEQGTVVTLEVQLMNALLLRLLGGESTLQFNVLWRHAY